MAYGFYFDSTRCTGCRTCEMACKDYHDLSTEAAFRRVFDYEGGQCIVQIAYDKPSGADYPVEVSGYKMWASTVQTVGTKNEQPVGKKQKTGISRLSEIEEYCRGSGRRMVLRADRGALRAGCRRRC